VVCRDRITLSSTAGGNNIGMPDLHWVIEKAVTLWRPPSTLNCLIQRSPSEDHIKRSFEIIHMPNPKHCNSTRRTRPGLEQGQANKLPTMQYRAIPELFTLP
jgi:hypothetical protein